MTPAHPQRPRIRSIPETPLSCTFVTHDFDELIRLYPGWTGRFEQITPGPFRGEVEIAQGGLLRIFRGIGNQTILTRGLGADRWVDFSPVTERNEQVRWQGRQSASGHLVVRGPAVEIDNVTTRNNEVLTVSIRANDLQRAAATLLQSDADLSRIRWSCLPTAPDRLSRLDASARELLKTAARDRASQNGPAKFRQLEQQCLGLMLENFVRTPTGHHESPRRRREILRRGEEYLRESLIKGVGLLELCSELGVSARTLQYAFLDQFGVGPIEYFRKLRLNSVRRELKRAAGSGRTIRQIALDFGFSHFGNFAADYRRQFGELPSETLRARH